jgi:hypothetical protein
MRTYELRFTGIVTVQSRGAWRYLASRMARSTARHVAARLSYVGTSAGTVSIGGDGATTSLTVSGAGTFGFGGLGAVLRGRLTTIGRAGLAAGAFP